MGFSVERDAIGNVFARRPGVGKPLLLNAHLDTVVPGKGIQPVVADGIIRSDGRTILGSDDKAGVAVLLEVLQVAQEANRALPPLEVLLTVQEEVGLCGAKAFDISKLTAREGIGLDAGGPIGTINVAAPSQDCLAAVIHGRAAHAGAEPEKGISAIRVAAEAIAQMPLGRIDEETTANIGIIHGGQATNIVCDRLEMQGEARSRNDHKLAAQTRAMVAALEEAASRHGARAEITVSRAYSAFSLSPDEPIIRLLAAAARQVGLEPAYEATGGGSDTNIFNAAGVRIANMSCGMAQAHTLSEHIAIADMAQAAEMLLAALCLRTSTTW
jgi:tripeptide aminopeptidase